MVLRTYCLVCKKHTDNYGSKNVNMTKKVIRNKSRCNKNKLGELYFMYLMVYPHSLFFKQSNNIISKTCTLIV